MYRYFNQLKPHQQAAVRREFAGWKEHELRGKKFAYFSGAWHAAKAEPRPLASINTIGMVINKFDKNS